MQIEHNTKVYFPQNRKESLQGDCNLAEGVDVRAAVETNTENKSMLQNNASFLQQSMSPMMPKNKGLCELIAAGDMKDYLSELSVLKARRDLVAHGVGKKSNELQTLLQQYPERARSFDVLSSKELNDLLAKAIDITSDTYLDVFQQAVEKNAAFYRDFTDFISKLKSFITVSDDKTVLNASGFREELKVLMDQYKVPSLATTLYPDQTGNSNLDECEAWAREMGLDPTKCVTESPLGSNSYIVHIDVSPLETILASVNPTKFPTTMTCNSAEWASWQTGLDMQKDTIQTGMQTLTQKYSNANSTFDNLIKVLSSTISSFLEADKGFLHF
ncbi:IpaD/SipD/SspD family type III secretion system needle tip protein [Yersinia kristensenii]|uniref:IpaD/SipD/SspD family type III secretion system needle tip protein n=1 Tax=Yersinia kristensenii TaxID=28152 RepID=UPI0005E5517F|nr:IpaD/SipD/SspD family type III secretion system needle tip protein [Yersinia kristensenii]CNF37974.1 Salmonella invasion protein D [Yersinia kristensenii]